VLSLRAHLELTCRLQARCCPRCSRPSSARPTRRSAPPRRCSRLLRSTRAALNLALTLILALTLTLTLRLTLALALALALTPQPQPQVLRLLPPGFSLAADAATLAEARRPTPTPTPTPTPDCSPPNSLL
jgi:hypothetical protein